jgi:hypothetical protein
MWKRHLTGAGPAFTRPQALWKKLWKTGSLWICPAGAVIIHSFHRQLLGSGVEMWKTFSKLKNQRTYKAAG